MSAISLGLVRPMQFTATREAQKDNHVLGLDVILFGFSDCSFYLAISGS